MFPTPIYYGILLSMFDIIMESLTKFYSISKNRYLLIFACMIYSIQPVLFSQSLNVVGIGVMNITWNIISTCIILAVGVMLFNEKMNCFNLLGVILSIISLILLNI